MQNLVVENLKAGRKFASRAAALVALAWFASVGVAMAAPPRQVYTPGQSGIGYPKCAYCPNPSYSEQALKARYEGTVLLQAVITAQGRATRIIVVRVPGLGLDKQAVEVVKRWVFKPAMGPGGSLVDVRVPIEVTFRLPTKKDSREGSF